MPANPDAMRKLRERMLTTPFAELGIEATSDYPRVYGVVMDFPIDVDTATVVSLCDGNASLYTTSAFGVIGGMAHETVRQAARAFVKAAEDHYDDSSPTGDFGCPAPGRVRFYLLTYEGVRMVEANMESVGSGRHGLSALFMEGQAVLTELRLSRESDDESSDRVAQQEWSGEPGYVNCLLTAMSAGAINSVEVVASLPVPNLLELIPFGHDMRDWVEAQGFPYAELRAEEVIHVLYEAAECTGAPSVDKHAELPTFHAVDDGGLVARVFDGTISAFNKKASVRLAPDDDPRVVTLQLEADAEADD